MAARDSEETDRPLEEARGYAQVAAVAGVFTFMCGVGSAGALAGEPDLVTYLPMYSVGAPLAAALLLWSAHRSRRARKSAEALYGDLLPRRPWRRRFRAVAITMWVSLFVLMILGLLEPGDTIDEPGLVQLSIALLVLGTLVATPLAFPDDRGKTEAHRREEFLSWQAKVAPVSRQLADDINAQLGRLSAVTDDLARARELRMLIDNHNDALLHKW